MPLLCSNTRLDRAIERLDHVIARYPALISARHARGTAHFRKWLNSTPIQIQQLRTSPLTYPSRYLLGPADDAPAGDALALHRARRDYVAILERETLPRILADLAVLEAYAGSLQPAQRRAEQALRLAPDDPAVLNHLGVIHFLAGDVVAAARDFEQAARSADVGRAWIEFNRAKCAALLANPLAPGLLRNYLQLDLTTDWRREALELLEEPLEVDGRMARLAPPVLPGLTLRTSSEQIIRRYGAPSRERRWRSLLLWGYDAIGLELTLSPADGTIQLDLCKSEPGEIEGVRVGDPLDVALRRWGAPVESSEANLVFWAGEWGIGLEYDDRRIIVTLSLGAIQ